MQAASRRFGSASLSVLRRGLSPLTGTPTPAPLPFSSLNPQGPPSSATGTVSGMALPFPAFSSAPLSPLFCLAGTSRPLLRLSGASAGPGASAGTGTGKGAGAGIGSRLAPGLPSSPIFRAPARAAYGDAGVSVPVGEEAPSEGEESKGKKKAKKEKKEGEEKEKKPKKKTKDGPKRPLSAYIRFSMESRPKVISENPEMKFAEVGKLLGERWRTMSDLEKQPFVDAYKGEMAVYEKEHGKNASKGASPEES